MDVNSTLAQDEETLHYLSDIKRCLSLTSAVDEYSSLIAVTAGGAEEEEEESSQESRQRERMNSVTHRGV